MVSAAYLAQYKADRELAPVRNSFSSSFTESQVVTTWDGMGSYLATWKAQSNRTNYGSICENYYKFRLSIGNEGRDEAVVHRETFGFKEDKQARSSQT